MFHKILLVIAKLVIIIGCLLNPVITADAQNGSEPEILVVTAHPDDDALFSATLFKTTKLLGGVADLAIATNGEGGYKYSTLGEFIYHKNLDKEEVGRKMLPGIRKMEVMKGGEIVGIRNYYFLEQVDDEFSTDISNAFKSWDTAWVRKRLYELMKKNKYDFVFTMLPTGETHAHHKASAVLAMEAAQKLKENDRPIVLSATIFNKDDEENYEYKGLEGFEIAKPLEGVRPLEFDRTQKFGFDDRLNYKIIGNWVIAEHKSQGTMQLFMNRGDVEQYWYLALNGPEKYARAKAFFEAVNEARIYQTDKWQQ